MAPDRDAGLDEYFADYERRATERRARRRERRHRRPVPGGELGALLASPAGRTLVGLVAAIAALTLIGLAVLWPRGDAQPRGQSLPPTLPAQVEAVRETACNTPTPQRCRQIVVRVERTQSTLDLGPITSAPEVSTGRAVRVTEVPRTAGVAQPRDAPRYSFVDVERRQSILVALAGMIVGALGVLADTAVTQASAVMALRRSNPALSARGLYAAALVVGRDHLSATIHTLVLAYAGAVLPLLLILANLRMTTVDALNTQAIAEPAIATAVGCVALIAAVPLTTGLAAVLVAKIPHAQTPDVHSHPH